MNKRQKIIGAITQYMAPISEYACLVEDYVKGMEPKIEVLNSTMIIQDRPDEGFEVVQLIVLTTTNNQGKVQFSIMQVYHEANPAMGVEAIDIEEVGKKIIELMTDYDPTFISERAADVSFHCHKGGFVDNTKLTDFKYKQFVEEFRLIIA